MSGALAAAFLVASGVFVYSWWAYFLPVPAFVDWVGRKLDFFSGGKLSTFGTGIVMGTSVPYFLYGAITLNPAAFAFAAGYLAFYALILLAGKRGRASTDQKPRKGDSRIA